MARTVTYRGVVYTLPSRGDPDWDKNLNAFLSAVSAPDTLELANPSEDPAGQAAKVLFRSRGSRLEVSENGTRWRRVVGSDAIRDIREYATASENLSGDATGALQLIMAEISAVPGTVKAAEHASIFVPDVGNFWTVSQTATYVGNPSVSLNIYGEHCLSRNDNGKGSGLKWTGASGGLGILDLRGVNGSRIQDIGFHGNRLAKYLLRLRHYYDAINGSISSSGVHVRRCRFSEPVNDYASALVAAGATDLPGGSTPQCSEYRFFDCDFQGIDLGAGTKQGCGFLALTDGNTKNFFFFHPNFGQLWRCVQANSGLVVVDCPTISNIGRDRPSSIMFLVGGNCFVLNGGEIENGSVGYAAMVAQTGQGTTASITSNACITNAPGNDLVLKLQGPSTVLNNQFDNQRTAASQIAWVASTSYPLAGIERKNGTHVYTVVTPGTSASSGGPTGTGASITDGSVVWDYVAGLEAAEAKIQVPSLTADNGLGGAYLSQNQFVYPDGGTRIDAVPVYDGTGNHLGKGDYARSVSHQVRAEGNRTGQRSLGKIERLPDFIGSPVPCLRNQMWTDAVASDMPGASIVHNDDGLYAITVPASNLGGNSGEHDIALFPPFSKLTLAVANVTVAFAGSGLSGTIHMELGVQYGADHAAEYDTDGILTSFDVKSGVITKGKLGSHYGAQFDATLGGFVGNVPGGYQSKLKCLITVGAGDVANLATGSVIFYVQFQRLGP